MEKQKWEESEERKSQKKEDQRRERVRRKKMQVHERSESREKLRFSNGLWLWRVEK